MHTLSISDIQPVEGEPRVQDLTLAERLGFERPRAIRQIVDRNKIELEGFGALATRRGKSRGQEFTEFWLNEPQALLICMFSRTPQAADVRRQIVDVFMAWRRGEQPSAPPRLSTAAITASELHTVEGEARIKDVVLGHRLGLPRPDKIRSNLIRPSLDDLLMFGAVFETPTNPRNQPVSADGQPYDKRGRAGTVYWLNKCQAMLVCKRSYSSERHRAEAELAEAFATYVVDTPVVAPAPVIGPIRSLSLSQVDRKLWSVEATGSFALVQAIMGLYETS